MLAVGFHNITEALACESYGKANEGFPGRLGPVPMFMSAGCGYAWLVEDEGSSPAELETLLKDAGLGFETIQEG